MSGKLNLEFQDLPDARSVKALTFTGRMEKVKGFIASGEDKGAGTLEEIVFKTINKSDFLFCPRCSLRRPKDKIAGYYGGYCPVCGCIMAEEGSIPCFPCSGLKVEYDAKNKIRREILWKAVTQFLL
jgi:hypothetical protein